MKFMKNAGSRREPKGREMTHSSRAGRSAASLLVVVIAGACVAIEPGAALGQVSYERIKSFGFPAASATAPYGRLLRGSDGWLYGTSGTSANSNSPTVFRLARDGSECRILHNFTGTNGDGGGIASLIEARDHILYGATSNGGIIEGTPRGGFGTVFKMNRDGTGYAVLLRFTPAKTDGQYPFGVVEGGDGALYGTTQQGGSTTWAKGTVFKLNKDGSGYVLLCRFAGIADQGPPASPPIWGTDGMLYGTAGGGASSRGVVYRLRPDGSGYSVILDLESTGGSTIGPASLIEGRDGVLYGVGGSVVTGVEGTVFRFDKDGRNFQVLHEFRPGSGDGFGLMSSLTEGDDGALYGTTDTSARLESAGTLFKLNKNGSSYAILHEFARVGLKGHTPRGPLTPVGGGLLYGTAILGGNYGQGTMYQLREDGTQYETVRHFSPTGGDGINPDAGLVEGPDGVLFDTTENGGDYPFGTVFRMRKDGTSYAILHHFSALAGEAFWPKAKLAVGSDGVLYGTASAGGSLSSGCVFRLNGDGSGTTSPMAAATARRPWALF